MLVDQAVFLFIGVRVPPKHAAVILNITEPERAIEVGLAPVLSAADLRS